MNLRDIPWGYARFLVQPWNAEVPKNVEDYGVGH